MKSKTTYIKNPSSKLLDFARKLQTDNAQKKAELLAQKDKFFSKTT